MSVFIGLRAASYKRPLFSSTVSVAVCVSTSVSAGQTIIAASKCWPKVRPTKILVLPVAADVPAKGW